jgi:putative Holliday junction resolvase
VEKNNGTENDIFLGIDYGESNIGLAFGRNGLVTPLRVISGKDTNTAIQEISRVIKQNRVTKVIVGIPLTANGKETQTSLRVRSFVKLLKIFTKKPVEFYNEHLSTVEAREGAIERGIDVMKKANKIDHLSAAIILKSYFNENT